MKKYLKNINNVGYFSSFKNKTLKEKVILGFNAIPCLINNYSIKKETRKKTQAFFSKIRKDNNIKSSKYFWLKIFLYLPFFISSVFIKSLTAFLLLLTVLNFLNGTESTKDFFFKDATKYYTQNTKESHIPSNINISEYKHNPFDTINLNTIIKEENKLNLNDFKESYNIKGKDNRHLIYGSIKKDSNLYFLNKNNVKISLVLNANYKIMHYRVIYNSPDLFHSIIESSDKANIHNENKNTITRIESSEEKFFINKIKFINEEWGVFDSINPKRKAIENYKMKGFTLEDNNSFVYYYDMDIKNNNPEFYAEGAKFNNDFTKILNSILLIFLLFLIEQLYLKKKINTLLKNEDKNTLDEYTKKNNISNNTLLLEDKRDKKVILKNKTTKIIKI
jgi:hypothetical protein